MATSIENQRVDAESAVSELCEAVAAVKAALDNLEGVIDDVTCLDNLDITWRHGAPDILNMLSEVDLASAEFSFSRV